MGVIVDIAEALEGLPYRLKELQQEAQHQVSKAKTDARNRKLAPKCRCGMKAVPDGSRWKCPSPEAEVLFVKHDLVAQWAECINPGNWSVKKEPGGWRPQCSDDDQGPMLHASENEAWAELEEVYWGHLQWPQDEDEE